MVGFKYTVCIYSNNGNASLPGTREIPAAMQGILEKISGVIGGTVIMEDDSFYVLKKDGQKVDFSLEAEGLRKLGLLWKLIHNGLLEEGAILLWDEPEAFNPLADKKVSVAIRKFYDSLHYLRLLDKKKPAQYVYVLESPNGDVTMRKRLRNRLKSELPFVLQQNIGNGKKLIDKVDVVSMEEWNKDDKYGKYPIKEVACYI